MDKGSDLVASVLRDRFEFAEGPMDNAQAAEYLSRVVQELPGESMKVVAVVGGPASGKDTLVNLAADKLRQSGLRADAISTDDYNLGTREWRHEREREDPLKLKDFSLLNEHLRRIAILEDGETVALPVYDELTGLAIAAGEEDFLHKAGETDVMFVQGDFDAVEAPNLHVFIDVPTETRLQARIKRDTEKRGEADPEKVAANFRSRQEKQFAPLTAPTIKRSDLVFKVTPTPDSWQYNIYRRTSQND